ncbi:tetratricopeptide repeat protein [Brumimicrobium mesophilum]|uniref:tetratricopeptide repeat protein n=1 Tax=Brumimicrobium mesophilum TaxID=392717 RepID=UPI000D141537|nr:tetratricopeptide repeat protein [Brumimicrobium mesophilum]
MKLTILSLLLFLNFNFIVAQTAEEYNLQSIEKANEGKYSAALKDIDKALEIDSLNIEYLISKAYLHYDLKEFQESYNVFSHVIFLDGNSVSYNGRGMVMETVGEMEMAIEDYSMAIDNAENDTIRASALSNRAASYSKIRNFNLAYEDLIKAYSIDSTSLSVLTNLGAICDEIGKGDETLKYLLKALEVDPDFYPAYGNIGYKYQEMGQHEMAIKYYDKVLEFNPEEPLGYSNRSFNYYKLGDFKQAMKDIDKSLKLYPSNSYAYRVKALILLKDGKTEKACENLQIAIEYGFTERFGNEVLSLQREFCK